MKLLAIKESKRYWRKDIVRCWLTYGGDKEFIPLWNMSSEFDMSKRKRKALAGVCGLESSKVICRQETKELAFDKKLECKLLW